MDYRDALHHLLGLVDYERILAPTRERVRYDLRRMEALESRLGNPHAAVPAVHIAGTKGKGSTAAMCASVLSRQGYRTGLYTSPHLHTFRERIRMDGEPVSEGEFAGLVEEVWPHLEWVSAHEGHGGVTMFEALTAMAFCHFKARADLQVLEVGLGGRLDTTNVVVPRVSAVTSLSLDHTAILGDTIESIAAEKAGIVKPGVPVVTSPQVPAAMATIEAICRERGSRLVVAGRDITWTRGARGCRGQSFTLRGRLGEYRLSIPLLGDYQVENAATALGVLEVLGEGGFPVTQAALAEGFEEVSWPCRMEVLSDLPLVVCDGAHNDHSAARLRDSLPHYFDYGRVILVVGVSRDKNLKAIAAELAALAQPGAPRAPRLPSESARRQGMRVIATRSRHPRAAPPQAVANAFLAARSALGATLEVAAVESVEKAVSMAMGEARATPAHPGDLVLVTGSLFVAAEAREALKGITPELYPEMERPADAALR
jgi:dihydrofolate synthase/folylpolyglutamate synthase